MQTQSKKPRVRSKKDKAVKGDFVSVAHELECDESKQNFERQLEKIAKAKVRADKGQPSAIGKLTVPRLHRRAGHGPKRTKNATVALQRLKPFAASLAVIEELAGVRRHRFGGLISAFWAGNGRCHNHCSRRPDD